MAKDSGRLTPLADPDKSSNESSPLLHNDRPPRPYQAYCVTEASSRPPSPDTLTPRPLRLGDSLPTIRDDEPRYLPSSSLAPSMTTPIHQKCRDAETVPTAEDGSDEEERQANENATYGNTKLVSSNHITQAVIPRGSLPLMDNEPTLHDRTPSQVRMQQSTPAYVATTLTCRREPVPQHAVDTSMVHRPLPPLPLEIAPSRASYDVQRALRNADFKEPEQKHAWRPSLAYFGIGKLGDGPGSQSQGASPTPFETEATHESGCKSTRPNDMGEAGPTVPLSLDTHLVHQISTPRSHSTSSPAYTDFGGHIQLPSNLELYEPRGLLSEMDDDRRAFRRTQPKDAKLKYQFGRRPSMRLDKPPIPPPHQSLPNLSVGHHSPVLVNTQQAVQGSRRPSPSPSPTSRSYADPQAGPRPPPWGSSDNLELRRQTRSEAREREEARRYRMTIDSGSSIYKGSESTDSLRRNTMRREVEEYREQVLQIYPDMEFDGTAGKGGRSCYCVVM